MNNSLQNIKLIPDNIEAYQNAYKANKQSQYFAAEQFQTSNVLLLDLLQTERDFLAPTPKPTPTPPPTLTTNPTPTPNLPS